MSDKKKVLHIVTVSFVINHFFGNQFKYLNNKYGNEYYLGCSNSKEFFDLAKSLGFTPFVVEITRNISPIKDIKAIISLIKFIRKNEIDVVVGHTPKGGMVAMIASYLSKISNRIYFRHGIIYETSTGFKRFLLKNIDRLSGFLANRVVCVSSEVKSISEKDRLNATNKNIILGKGTCNGIDTHDRFNPDNYNESSRLLLRNSLGISNNDRVIGYVGRLVRDKGINELVLAWQELKKNYSNIKLLLVGPIESRDSISEEVKMYIKNDDSIITTGFILNAAPYFAIMDIFILPTYREGFPTVTLEASSMEIPVLITKATGCSESIIHDHTGFFIENNESSIINGIMKYLNDDQLIRSHGINGRKLVLENFDEKKIWEEIHDKLGY